MRKLLLDIQSKYKDNWDGAGAKQPNDLAIQIGRASCRERVFGLV
jgi:hypothetical protein